MEIVIKKFEELSLDELYEIILKRINIFVVEQKCAYSELDNFDQKAYHVYMKDENEIVGYLRVVPQNQYDKNVVIGRVISLKRRQGIATSLLKKGIEVATKKFKAEAITIFAQTYAIPLYAGVGFKVVSDEYEEDGIPHVKMEYIIKNVEK